MGMTRAADPPARRASARPAAHPRRPAYRRRLRHRDGDDRRHRRRRRARRHHRERGDLRRRRRPRQRRTASPRSRSRRRACSHFSSARPFAGCPRPRRVQGHGQIRRRNGMVRKHTRRAAKAAFAISIGVALLIGMDRHRRRCGEEHDDEADDHDRHEELRGGVHPRPALRPGARGEGLPRRLQGELRLVGAGRHGASAAGR